MSDSLPPRPAGPGLLFGPGPEGSWDSERVSSPCVLRCADGQWRMWYYGRDPSFDREINLPTGRCGLAISDDGIDWRRVTGPGVMGSVLDPHPDPARFDSGHVGVSCMVEEGDAYWMWYFGGSQERQEIGQFKVRGFDLRPGVAVSRDGVHFARVEGPVRGAFLDLGLPGGAPFAFVGWPQVVADPAGGWRMYYHTLSMEAGFQICLAVSADGFNWEKRDVVLSGDRDNPDAFDLQGCATRTVLQHQGQWIMLYEGVRPNGDRSMGLATSADGLSWTKEKGPEPDGSVFAHAEQGKGLWDDHGIGCPSVVALPDGGLRMYYIGSCHYGPEGSAGEMALLHQIGLAISDGDPTRWRRHGA